MLNMVNLVRNENMKLFHKVSTWVMTGILILLLIAVGTITKLGSTFNTSDNWKSQLTEQNKQLEEAVKQPGVPKSAKDASVGLIKTNEYRIEHNIPPTSGLWDFVDSSAGEISFISLFAIIIGGGIVANEFSAGTIKLLLIRPSRRWKILISKYISVLYFILMLLVILFVSSFLLGGLLFSFKGAASPYLSYSGGQVHVTSMVLHSIGVYLLECVKLIMMVTLAFMISTVFRNSSLAIGIGIFLLFTGSIATQLLSQYSWSKYILFQNTDLSVYISGNPPVEGMTMTFSIIVLLVYFAIFNVISFLVFSKRDVSV